MAKIGLLLGLTLTTIMWRPLLGFPKPDPWPKFGLQWAVYIAVALAVMQYFSLKPNSEIWLKVVPILPSILFYAALNSFNEEITYHSPLLATLEPIGGSRQALWMAAYFFGIAHYKEWSRRAACSGPGGFIF